MAASSSLLPPSGQSRRERSEVASNSPHQRRPIRRGLGGRKDAETERSRSRRKHRFVRPLARPGEESGDVEESNKKKAKRPSGSEEESYANKANRSSDSEEESPRRKEYDDKEDDEEDDDNSDDDTEDDDNERWVEFDGTLEDLRRQRALAQGKRKGRGFCAGCRCSACAEPVPHGDMFCSECMEKAEDFCSFVKEGEAAEAERPDDRFSVLDKDRWSSFACPPSPG